MKKIAILGSTGSIGTQALDIISNHPESFTVEVITANNNIKLLIAQTRKFIPNVVVIANEQKYNELKEAVSDLPVKVYCGMDAIAQVVQMSSIDIVLTAMVGYAGLLPTIKAIEAKKTIALANKETLVVAGELIMKLAQKNRVNILPVDSEHSAIFQCLVGESQESIEKIILTASGGPFYGYTVEQLKKVTKKQTLCHPNWNMGAKITIDSATMMNKGFEAIEAKWLFGISPKDIEIIVHPQSIIHSLVQFHDSSIKAQMGLPDMRLPILYALSFPNRLPTSIKRFSFLDYPELKFLKPDKAVFKSIDICFNAMEKKGNAACVVNAANEVAVQAFLENRIKFLDIYDVIEKTIQKVSFILHPDYNQYVETDKVARSLANELVTKC